MKRVRIIFFGVILIVGIIHFRYFITRGVISTKVLYDFPYKKENEQTGDDFAKYSYVFEKPLVYIGKGRQSYAYETYDKKYVVKFMRAHKYKKKYWAEIFDYFHILSNSQKEFNKTKKYRLNRLINSNKLAYDVLNNYTQVDYVHLNQTGHLLKEVKLKNRFGYIQTINLDKTAFVIQKKFANLDNYMKEAAEAEEFYKIDQIVDSFLKFLTYRTDLNIVNIDVDNIIRNAGVYEGKYVELDVGSYVKLQKDCDKELSKQYFLTLDVFRNYLKELHYDLSNFDAKVQKEKECLGI